MMCLQWQQGPSLASEKTCGEHKGETQAENQQRKFNTSCCSSQQLKPQQHLMP